MSNIVCEDVMQINATPEQVREFIRTPERIADYFPDVIEYGSLIPGKDVWCSAKSGVSLLQFDEADCTDNKLTMTVYNASKHDKPYTEESIKSRVFLTMVEDWITEPHEGGTKLTKIWRNVKKYGFMKILPMNSIIRKTAKEEHQPLIDAWNKAASK